MGLLNEVRHEIDLIRDSLNNQNPIEKPFFDRMAKRYDTILAAIDRAEDCVMFARAILSGRLRIRTSGRGERCDDGWEYLSLVGDDCVGKIIEVQISDGIPVFTPEQRAALEDGR